MSILLSLYPKRWRERYGEEFAVLLAERPPSLRDRLDIVAGALDARMHPQLARSAPGPERVSDRFGFAPLLGLVAFASAVFLAATGPVQHDEYGSYRDGGAALPFIILAFVLLSVGLYRVIESLPRDAVLARVAGWIAIAAGLLWSPMPWMMPIAIVFMLGTVGLAIGARRAGTWPTWALVLLVVPLAFPVLLFGASLFMPWYWLRGSGIAPIVFFACIATPWPLVAGVLLRGTPRPTVTPTLPA
jgi:hypothetical protein